GVSGCLLSFVAIVFIPEQVLSQQLLLLGLLSVVAISASIAFAVNFYLFICYVACGCLPIIYVYLTADSALLNGLGLLMLMYLAAMTAAVIQVNRLLNVMLQQRASNQQLISTLQATQQESNA